MLSVDFDDVKLIVLLLLLTMEKEQKSKILIGRRDLANLPDFGLNQVEVKVDSGAYTSSIHVSLCQEVEKEGSKVLEVVFLDEKHPSFISKKHYFTDYRMKKVKSSTGQEQMRYFIKTRIELLGKKFKTEFSLTKRSGMKYPILLGRKLLNKRFIIDTSLVNLSKKSNSTK